MIYKIVTVIILLILSAFFSGSETALFSLKPLTLRKLARDRKDARHIKYLLKDPTRMLATILIGNMLVNIIASVIVSSISIDLLGDAGIGIAIGIMTLLLLLFGEVTPKTLAIEHPVAFSLFCAQPLIIFSKLIFPLRWCLRSIADNLIPVWGQPVPQEPTVTEEELKTIIDVGQKEGVVAKQEREMIRAVLEFTDTDVKEVFTPRVDIKAISITATREEALQLAKEYQHSKIPIYTKSLDKIMGVIYAKELLLQPKKKFTELIKPVLFVPGTKKIDELLQIFEQQKLKIAIVVDEYGGTDGMVTMEDILEEIFGEIYDEFETPEKLIEDLGDNRHRVVGKIGINDINESLETKLPEEEHETLAGLILDRFGKIPTTGETIRIESAKIVIEKMAGRRITSVIIETKKGKQI